MAQLYALKTFVRHILLVLSLIVLELPRTSALLASTSIPTSTCLLLWLSTLPAYYRYHPY